jgi:hypothetical protein
MGGTPVDIGMVPYNLDGSAEAGIGLFVIAGLRHTYPELAERLDPHLTPYGRATLDRLARACAVSNVLTTVGQPYNSLFTEDFRAVWASPEIRSIVERARLGKHATTVPRLIYHGVGDEVVPISDVDKYVASECARGADLTVRREALALHLTTAVSGLPLSLDWLDQKTTGSSPDSRPGCDITTVPSFVAADPGATLGVIAQTVRGLLGIPE